jgi:exopolysaccharide biosynthesis polyprenyl glycosylphosphotransferase
MSEWLDALSTPLPSALPGAATASVRAAAPSLVRPRQHEVLFGQLVLALDAAVLSVSFFAAHGLRDSFSGYGSLLPVDGHLWVLGLVLAVSLVLVKGAGLTSSQSYLSLRPLILTTLRVHVIASLLVLSALYLMRAIDVSRLWMQTFVLLAGAAVVLERVAIRTALAVLAAREHTEARRLLVVGGAPSVARLQQLLDRHPHWGARVHGYVSHAALPNSALMSAPSLGVVDDVPALLDTMVFDDVIVADEAIDAWQVQRLGHACLERGVTFHTLMPVPVSTRARYRTETLADGLCLMSVETVPQSALPMLAKRALDIAGGVTGLILCALAYIVFAPLIRLESSGPSIFQQTRVGRNGRLFKLYKFRTMRSDAEAQKAMLAAENHMSGFLFKIKDDPRVTRVGRLLRRLYVDELPQFWNVLKGDMSLVGTRPPTPDEYACYEPQHRRRLSIRPGVTGPWQVRGNGMVTDFEEVVRLDCEYIDHWSMSLDLSILLRTFLTVMRMGGH